MTEDRLAAIERTLEELAPIVRALGDILVQRKVVNERVGLNKNTLSQNPNVTKFEDVGSRRTLIQISDIAVVKRKKTRRGTSR
jgi:hypothetical protein